MSISLMRVNRGKGISLAPLTVVCNDIAIHGSDAVQGNPMLGLPRDRACR
ncbi:MAG: hypothetical protein LJE56_09175 [Acidiferrobacterales bacterium]|nr:hypothetical protein [Acidiferrobacterales bacterium]